MDGDKRQQQSDIKQAHLFWEDWQQGRNIK